MMKANRLLRTMVIALLLISTIGCDQVSKNFVRSRIPFQQRFHYLDDHVMFTRVENRGAFLSLGDSLSSHLHFFVLIVIPCLALLAGLVLLFGTRNLSRSNAVALSFIIGGGLGNIYDRYMFGSVTDFVHINFFIFRTGIFNLADVAIMGGGFIFLITWMYQKYRRPLLLEEEA